jgi:hypothetical protein
MSQLINQIEALGFQRKDKCKLENLNELVNRFENSNIASSLFEQYVVQILSLISEKHRGLDKTYTAQPDKLVFELDGNSFFLMILQQASCKITISLRSNILSIYPQFQEMADKPYSKITFNNGKTKNDRFTFEINEQTMQDFTDVFIGRVENKIMEETESQGTSMNSDNDIATSPLNQILYGPPGTGKTYHSIEAAVKAAEPAFYASLDIDAESGATTEQRRALTKQYKTLSDAGRIRFVTFHQSYGYEEFVEGLRASSEGGLVSYDVEPGVFKSICEEASLAKVGFENEINPDGKVWKISINGVHENAQKTYCFDNHLAAIGWGYTGDLSVSERNDYFNKLVSHDRNSITSFSKSMEIGDLILCINSNSSIEAIGVVSGGYFYNEDGLLDRDDFKHFLPVKWLAKGIDIDFKSLNGNRKFHTPTCNLLKRLTVTAVLNHLVEHHVTIGIDELKKAVENYVLIIDEINRGNISKIFGELITLIEPSKRQGKKEALELILPQSKTLFSVPDNLYIIGTMNTADRSLAMMDTALRRRFDFVEMMPNAELFNGKSVKGIDLQKLLETMNKRIEVLYDREHTLGHAFFIPVKSLVDDNKEDVAFIELKSVFKNKIIPLLEEYFFEDWNKIRLVLGDNQKDKSLRFVTKTKESYDTIFGNNHGLDSYETGSTSYTLASFDGVESVWGKAAAYIGIYPSKPVEVNKSDSESEAA